MEQEFQQGQSGILVGLEQEFQREWNRDPVGDGAGILTGMEQEFQQEFQRDPGTHLVPEGDLTGVPAGHSRGQEPFGASQENHAVDAVVLAAGLLQGGNEPWNSPWTQLSSQEISFLALLASSQGNSSSVLTHLPGASPNSHFPKYQGELLAPSPSFPPLAHPKPDPPNSTLQNPLA